MFRASQGYHKDLLPIWRLEFFNFLITPNVPIWVGNANIETGMLVIGKC